jgi:hypothetical protein
MKPYLACINCGDNFKVVDELGKCQCGRYVRKVIDCEICGYSHKVRSPEFCRALHSKEGLDSIDKELFLSQSQELKNNA